MEISLNYEEETIQIQIRDDGIGFNVGEQSSGLGLRSMRERIELIKGDLHIISKTGEGTLIRVVAPVKIK